METRKSRRVPCHLRCRCEADSLVIFARVGNLSEGGVFVRTSTPLEPGASARVHVGSADAIVADARVRWARVEGEGGTPGMGLAFEGLDEATRVAIQRVMCSEQTD